MEARCVICGKTREEGFDFCFYHKHAYERIKEAYDLWKRSTGVDWETFLSEIIKNPATGEWAKEVAKTLSKTESS